MPHPSSLKTNIRALIAALVIAVSKNNLPREVTADAENKHYHKPGLSPEYPCSLY